MLGCATSQTPCVVTSLVFCGAVEVCCSRKVLRVCQNSAKDDTQQSFWLAETLKYLYLLFSPDEASP